MHVVVAVDADRHRRSAGRESKSGGLIALGTRDPFSQMGKHLFDNNLRQFQ